MKAIYQILSITRQHNYVTTSYIPFDAAKELMFTSYDDAEKWLNTYLSNAGQTGEVCMMMPEYDPLTWDYTGKEVFTTFSREDAYSICKVKLMGVISELVDYDDADTDLPF